VCGLQPSAAEWLWIGHRLVSVNIEAEEVSIRFRHPLAPRRSTTRQQAAAARRARGTGREISGR
jgi:hypothetical protein